MPPLHATPRYLVTLRSKRAPALGRGCHSRHSKRTLSAGRSSSTNRTKHGRAGCQKIKPASKVRPMRTVQLSTMGQWGDTSSSFPMASSPGCGIGARAPLLCGPNFAFQLAGTWTIRQPTSKLLRRRLQNSFWTIHMRTFHSMQMLAPGRPKRCRAALCT